MQIYVHGAAIVYILIVSIISHHLEVITHNLVATAVDEIISNVKVNIIGNNVTSRKQTGDVNIQNSNITIQGKRLELRAGTRIDKNFKFQNR
jgi:hypothetical protein